MSPTRHCSTSGLSFEPQMLVQQLHRNALSELRLRDMSVGFLRVIGGSAKVLDLVIPPFSHLPNSACVLILRLQSDSDCAAARYPSRRRAKHIPASSGSFSRSNTTITALAAVLAMWRCCINGGINLAMTMLYYPSSAYVCWCCSRV